MKHRKITRKLPPRVMDKKTYAMRPFGPLLLVYPLVYTTRAINQAPPATAAGTGRRRPAISRLVRKGARFSVKLAWARCAQLSWKAAGFLSACSAVAYVFG